MSSKDSQVEHRNMGTRDCPPAAQTGYPWRPGMDRRGGGASVVVRARESRAHGEGKQDVDALAVAEETPVDSGDQDEQSWLLSVQRKLHQWSREHPNDSYRDLWNLVTDIRNLRCAWKTIASNKGKQTAGIDGETVGSIRCVEGVDRFLERTRQDLRTGRYAPLPVRRKWIPKRGKPGKLRPLGIPTVRDRVVQCAVKQIVEPVFEARFWHVSYGFRPGRGCHGALEHIRLCLKPRRKSEDGRRHGTPYQWVIEGDIKGCFDNIDHHQLMERVRLGVSDKKVNRLIVRFLKAGILDEGSISPSTQGTPQGGVLSPLLANIALGVIEERYERWTNKMSKLFPHRKSDGPTAASAARRNDRNRGVAVFFPIRYADDFVILVSGTREEAEAEKEKLAVHLREQLGLELAEEKTKITSVFDGFEFLGQRVRTRWDDRFGHHVRIEIPKKKIADFRHTVKQLTKRDRNRFSLEEQLHEINPILRGWANYHRFCYGAKAILSQLDWYVDDRLWRWMRGKHPRASNRWLMAQRKRTGDSHRKRWQEGSQVLHVMSRSKVERYRLAWMNPPDYA
jgi:RNA-directed DNA polymerase